MRCSTPFKDGICRPIRASTPLYPPHTRFRIGPCEVEFSTGANLPVIQKLPDHLARDLVSHGVRPNLACMMFTNKIVTVQVLQVTFLRRFIPLKHSLSLGILAGTRNRSTTCYACSVGLFSGRIEAVRRN